MTRAALVVTALVLMGAGAPALAQIGMPNPKEMSGSVLPVNDIPAGTVSVRLIRGSFDKNIAGQAIDFLVDGQKRTATTDETGHAQVAGLARGARVRAVTTVDGERLESQEAVVDQTGLRIILVATDPNAAAGAGEVNASAAGAVPGTVVLGPESRIVAQMADDQLTLFYVLQILNSAATPVDLGGPLIFELPREARGTAVLEGSSPMATANGARLTVLGPFPPGATNVDVAFELPYTGGTVTVDQKWPAAMQQSMVLVQQIGGLSLESAQLPTKQNVADQGQPLIVATGPGIGAGQRLTFQISGLPHHPVWPRYLALALAAVIIGAGLWGAATAPRRAVA
jgi:hypothetical protein